MKRFLVCGSRMWTDYAAIVCELAPLPRDAELIHGACPTGADAMADRIWDAWRCSITRFHADWSKYGRAAGPIRNQRMLDEGKARVGVGVPQGQQPWHRRYDRPRTQGWCACEGDPWLVSHAC